MSLPAEFRQAMLRDAITQAKNKVEQNRKERESVTVWNPDQRNKPQVMAYECEAFEILYGGGLGGGKALALDTPLITPQGWATIGGISIGDEVFDERGNICKVIATSNIMYNHKVYRVEFDDGSAIKADADHKWLTLACKERKQCLRRSESYRAKRRKRRQLRGTGKRPDLTAANKLKKYEYLCAPVGKIRTTQEISETVFDGITKNHSIAVCRALQLSEASLPIHPYVFGAWLGDGNSRGQGFTCDDIEIIDKIKACGYEVVKWSYDYAYGIKGIKPHLRYLNVLQNKHIPLLYLRASEKQRMELLRGIMDTDGHCGINAKCEFTSCNKALAENVLELLLSLGFKCNITTGRAKLNGEDYGEKYRIIFTTSRLVFHLTRKKKRLAKKERGTQQCRYIANVTEIPSEPVKCIAVNSESHLFLAGKSLIPTHNTDLILGLAPTKHTRSLLLRRTFPEVKRTFIGRSREIYGKVGTYNGSDYRWRIGEKSIEFGHVENPGESFDDPGDAKKYAGPRYDFIAFDQIEDFPEHVYKYVRTRAGTTKNGQRVQIVSTANPIGEHLDWIIKHWAPWLDETYPNPAQPGEIRYFRLGDDNTESETTADDPDGLSRTFIPAKLKDNPYLGEDYRRVVNMTPEPMRSALLNGDFTAMITDSANQVIPREWVKLAFQRWREREKPQIPISGLGVDASRGGKDQAVIAERRDNWFAPLRKYPGATIKDGQAVMALLQPIEIGDAPVNMDVIGIGSSPYDLAKEKYDAYAINYSEKSERRDKTGKYGFVNLRADFIWGMREALDPETGEDLALPDDPELLGDLCAARYTIQSNGIKIESKDEIKKRLGRSPDCGDAVCLARAARKVKRGVHFF